MNILIDTSPLATGHAIRGIGIYTRLLTESLEKLKGINVCKSADLETKKTFKPDIVHYPYFDFFFNTLPLISRYNRVVTIHDVIPLKFPLAYSPGKRGRLIFQKQKLALKKVQAVITDSQASKQDIVELLHVEEKKVHVVYLAGNPELRAIKDKKVIEAVKLKYNLPDKYILYVGDINYNKNIPQLIKALKFLPEEVQLVCVGKNFREQNIPEWLAIEAQVALSDVAKRIHFLPEITGDANEELSVIYTGALAYIQPSLAEGFGLPVLEAMQTHTPVVCTHNSSLIEVGGDHVIFVQTEAESIAYGISELLTWSQTKRTAWTRDARKWATKFNWEKTAKETLKVYQKIVTH